ncbi:MAG: PfkB family carbohydrate kinase [Longimicrobiales bacterium]
MLITVTPNPSLDLLFTAERLAWDDANRVPMPRRRPGGQGINVVRAVRTLAPGTAVRAVAPLGGPVGDELRQMLEAESTPLTAVPIARDTRVFVGVRESATGRSLLLNPRGPEVTAGEADTLFDAVVDALDSASEASREPGASGDDAALWLAACGSLLRGLPADFYARVGRAARARGFRFVPDGDGEALAAAVPEADLLVPNALEAGRLVGRAVETPEAAVTAARELRDRGPERVVVTLGRDGAVAVDGAGSWRARPVPPPDAAAAAGAALAGASAVGAGDAFLAALLLALGGAVDLPDAVADAVAAGTAVLLSSGPDLLRRADAAEVRRWVVVGAT